MKYVVLLRGINVGGNHKVPKGEPKEILEDTGLADVFIYINSGNAVVIDRHISKACLCMTMIAASTYFMRSHS